MRKQSLDLNQMLLFTEVVNQGSFTSAAETLGVSKSYVSKRMSVLEEELGVELLRRTTRKLYLTEEGERFLEYGRRVVETAEEGWRAVRNRGVEVAGHLRISAPVTYGQIFLPSLIESFCARHPRVEIDLMLANRTVDLQAENFDLAFRITDSPPTNYRLTGLGVMRDVVCGAPSLLKRLGPIDTPRKCAEMPCLLYLNPQRMSQWAFRKSGKLEVIDVTGSSAYNQHSALLGPLIEGRGLAKLPKYLVREHLEDGSLQIVLPDYDCGSIPIYLVHRELKEQPLRVTEFVRAVRAWARRDDAH